MTQLYISASASEGLQKLKEQRQKIIPKWT